MRKSIWNGFLGVLLVGLALQTVGCTRVGPGNVGIVVNMAGSGRGVQDYPITTGWVPHNPLTTSVLEYPTYVQTAVWTRNLNEGRAVNEEITFTTQDQLQVSADISLAYLLQADKVPAFYVKFRSDDLGNFTHGFLRNIAREKFDNIAGKYSIEKIMGDNGPFLTEVRTTLQKELDSIGVELQQFGFIGAPRPPESVTAAINLKVQATQIAVQKENELRATKAEAEKSVARAEGEARSLTLSSIAQSEANLRIAHSLTPELVEYQKLQKWDGKLPQVTGATPFVTIK